MAYLLKHEQQYQFFYPKFLFNFLENNPFPPISESLLSCTLSPFVTISFIWMLSATKLDLFIDILFCFMGINKANLLPLVPI